ncbi:MAG: ABC transporter permease [Gammaproteobacteria bacterium]|nr:ABC transporter permease [Gammaproteobacteria bacterium]MDP2347458.1 ABC transporter permease [Gammaproteobacteria bacterium]
MKMIWLIALREYAENVKTKGFWIGILLFPMILIAVFFFQTILAESAPTRHYILIDQSGRYAEAVETAIRLEHQRRILQEFVSYVAENRREANPEQTVTNAGAQIDQLIDDVDADEVAALEQWLENGGLNFALTMATPYLREGAPPFVTPREQFVPAPLPEGINIQASPQEIIAQLRPWLTGARQLVVNGAGSNLFAVILIPAGVDETIQRPGTTPMAINQNSSGMQYWASNLTDVRLPNAIERSINSTLRNNEFAMRGVDAQIIRDVQRTRLPVARLDPTAKEGQEAVSIADTFRQWAPVGFVYLMFVSLMQSVQYLLSNTIEEKSNRIIEVLLASVTPLELMMGKLLGIGISGITTIIAWLSSFTLFILFYPSAQTAMLGQFFDVLLSSDLIPYFVFYYLAGYALYAGIFLAIGSLCNTLKEAQSLMMPMMMILMVPLVTMTFIAQDPNGPVARIMSWIPLFTPFTMMNRAAAEPPMMDVIGTTIVLILTIALVLWLSGKIFRQGVLRTGQPPRIVEIVRMLRNRH